MSQLKNSPLGDLIENLSSSTDRQLRFAGQIGELYKIQDDFERGEIWFHSECAIDAIDEGNYESAKRHIREIRKQLAGSQLLNEIERVA